MSRKDQSEPKVTPKMGLSSIEEVLKEAIVKYRDFLTQAEKDEIIRDIYLKT